MICAMGNHMEKTWAHSGDAAFEVEEKKRSL